MQVNYLLACLLLVAPFLSGNVSLRASAKSSSAPRSQAADEWVHENYAATLRRVFPERLDLVPFPRDTKWVVVASVQRASGSSEFWMSLRRKYDGTAAIEIRVPHGESLFSQMKALKEKNPAATLETIAKMLRVDQYQVRNSECPQVKNLARDLEETRITPIAPDLLGLDLFEYHYWTKSQYGQEISAQLVGFGPQGKTQPHPLVAWIERARAAKAICLKDIHP